MYILKRIGLNNPTEIQKIREDGMPTTIVITKGLIIDELVQEWRDVFCDLEKMTVYADESIYNSINQRTKFGGLNVSQHLNNFGVFVKLKDTESTPPVKDTVKTQREKQLDYYLKYSFEVVEGLDKEIEELEAQVTNLKKANQTNQDKNNLLLDKLRKLQNGESNGDSSGTHIIG